MENFIDELKWRNLLHQTTADEELHEHLTVTGRVGYCGFDPTAESLTIGNFIAIKMLMHWQRAGNKPVVLMGGGTGLIGDPSGKDEERKLMSPETIEANIAGQRRIFKKLLDFSQDSPNAAVIVNNTDWLSQLGYLEMLRNVGKHFSINNMIQKDSVRERLNNREQGISYTEFSYMLLQAYDFFHLHDKMSCTVQIAGSDQYGNIVAGLDLIRRKKKAEEDDRTPAFGITSRLVTKSDGKKFGKSEKGAIWLTADKTSPYAFYQFWINTDDSDVVPFLKWFTFLDKSEIEEIAKKHEEAPHMRVGQRALAQHMTKLIHGQDALEKVEAASQALFGGDIQGLDAEMLAEVFADVPHSNHEKSMLDDGMLLVDLLNATNLAKSKREAREFIEKGAVSVNGRKQADVSRKIKKKDLLHGDTLLLRRGKKKWHATKWK